MVVRQAVPLARGVRRRLQARVQPSELVVIRWAARVMGVSLSRYVRDVVVAESQRVLGENPPAMPLDLLEDSADVDFGV
jgi:uncharacterized protein (DUF1778 family)